MELQSAPLQLNMAKVILGGFLALVGALMVLRAVWALLVTAFMLGLSLVGGAAVLAFGLYLSRPYWVRYLPS